MKAPDTDKALFNTTDRLMKGQRYLIFSASPSIHPFFLPQNLAWYFDAYYFVFVPSHSFSQFSSLKLEIWQMSLQIKKEAYISPSWLGFLPAIGKQ